MGLCAMFSAYFLNCQIIYVSHSPYKYPKYIFLERERQSERDSCLKRGGDRRWDVKPESSKKRKTEIDMEFYSQLAAAKFGFAAILIVIIITICFLHSYLQISLYHSYCQLAWLTRILTFYAIFHPSTFRKCVCFRGTHKKRQK